MQPDPEIQRQLDEILKEVVRKRLAGEHWSDEEILAAYPQHAEHLRPKLAMLRDAGTVDQQDTTEIPRPSAKVPDTIDQAGTQTKSPSVAGSQLNEAASPPGDGYRFQKLKLVAEGGMGRIWRARDGQITREVALKELKPEKKDDDLARRRLMAEGGITGELEHPGIVPVYALGFDALRQPYYTMRFVRGQTLTEAIKGFYELAGGGPKLRRGNSEFTALLRSLAHVCWAVAYAHSRGVLHRDLKPDNIILGKFGETYVMDWGLAITVGKRVEGGSTVSEEIVKPARVEPGRHYISMVGTTGFMSPEQSEGYTDRLTAATDVYSLGCILYYLLAAERKPINLETRSLSDLAKFRQLVQAGDYPDPRSLNPRAPKVLCAVCLKALKTDPAERYRSVRKFGEALEQWLDDEPVNGVPDSLLDKITRFSRRNYRWLVPVGAATVVISVGAMIAAFRIERAAQREANALAAKSLAEERATANMLEARDAVDQWLTGFTESLAYYPGAGAFRQQMLEQAAQRYQRLLAEAGNDAAVALEGGWTQVRLGDIRRQLLDYVGAIEAYQAAAKAFQQIGEKNPTNLAARGALARAYGRLALVHQEAGRVQEAVRMHLRAVKTSEQALANVRGDDDRRNITGTLGDLEINYANHLAQHGDMKAAADVYGAAIQRLEKLTAENDHIVTRKSLAIALLGLGQVTARQGNSQQAREIYRRAAKYLGAVAQLAEETPNYVEMVAKANLFVASMDGKLGNYQAEAEAYRKNIESYQRLNEQLPNVPDFQEELARTEIDLGMVLLKLEDPKSALQPIESAAGTFSRLKSEHMEIPRFREAYAVAKDLLATGHAILGHWPEALEHSQAAVAEFRSIMEVWPEIDEYRARTATSESQLAQILAARSKSDEALKHFGQAAQRLEVIVSEVPNDPSYQYAAAVVASRWGETLVLSGDTAGAIVQADAAAAHWQALARVTSDAEFLASAAWHYAAFPLPDKRDAARATTYAKACIEQAPKNAYYIALLGLAQVRSELPDVGAKTVETISEDNSGPVTLAVANFVAAMAESQLGERDQAHAAYDRAIEIMETRAPGSWELQCLRRQCDEALKER